MVDYAQLGEQIGILVNRKQQQYGDSFGKSGEVLKQLYPDGIKPDQYDDMLAVVRVIDKLFRIANGNQGEENAWRDIAGYGLFGAGRSENKEPQFVTALSNFFAQMHRVFPGA